MSNPASITTLPGRLAHACRVRSVRSLAAALASPFARVAPVSQWYLGRAFGLVVRLDGITIEFTSPTEAGTARMDHYETFERHAVVRWLDPAIPVIEFGAGLGFVSCLTNLRLHDRAAHVCVEADPYSVAVLTRNRERNQAAFVIRHAALGYDGQSMTFTQGDDHLTNMVGTGRRTITVPTTTLRDVVTTHDFDRCTVICDIEGAEIDLITREAPMFADCVQQLIVEWHPRVTGLAAISRAERLLSDCGLRLQWTRRTVSVYSRHERNPQRLPADRRVDVQHGDQ